jgi:putative acetyltransferase
LQIRAQRPTDAAAIRHVTIAAFGTAVEANLVEALLAEAEPVVSLVAEDAGALVGHILFSPVTLSSEPQLPVMGLAPMAVLPARQRQGIGSALVREGLTECYRRGIGALVVLGHPAYYPRFGFRPASHFGIVSEYDVPDDVFMALELAPGVLEGKAGTVRYHPAFGRVDDSG